MAEYIAVGVTLMTMVVGAVRAWYQLAQALQMQTKWIERHQEETDERMAEYRGFMTVLHQTDARLSALMEAHDARLTRLENRLDTRG